MDESHASGADSAVLSSVLWLSLNTETVMNVLQLYPSLPAVKMLLCFPVEIQKRIAFFGQHVHEYVRVYPEGPRDNGEYSLMCRTCGHERS